jgi:polyhydroxyalkanoate synthesis regulator phasin
LVTFGAPVGEEKKIPMSEVVSIASSLPGFIRMHEQMSKVMDELVKQGVLSKTKPEAKAK